MKHSTLVITALLMLLALCAFGQTPTPGAALYVGGGPSIHADAPHAGMNLTIGVCGDTTDNCLLTNYAARFDLGDVQRYVKFHATLPVSYTTTLAWRRVIARQESESGARFELFTLAAAGAAVKPDAVGFDGALGGGITYHPAKAPNWSISFVGQGDQSPLNPGWKPNVFWQAGYTFHRTVK